MRIAIVGGTGPFGTALAKRLRGPATPSCSAPATSPEPPWLRQSSESKGRRTRTPSAQPISSSSPPTRMLRSTPLGSCETPSARGRFCAWRLSSASAFRCSPLAEATSLAERIQDELDAPVVAGLHTLAASTLGSAEPPDEDAFVCGDDADAKRLALEVADRLIAGRVFDAGPLGSARALEGMIAVAVNLEQAVRRSRRHSRDRASLTGELRVIRFAAFRSWKKGMTWRRSSSQLRTVKPH